MPYTLEEFEISFFQSINMQLDTFYEGSVLEEIRAILLKVISSGEIELEEIKKLVALLPLQRQRNKTQATELDNTETDEEFDQEWPGWDESENSYHRQEIRRFQNRLTNLLFTQYAVYQKQVFDKERRDKSVFNSNTNGISK